MNKDSVKEFDNVNYVVHDRCKNIFVSAEVIGQHKFVRINKGESLELINKLKHCVPDYHYLRFGDIKGQNFYFNCQPSTLVL